MINNLFAKFEDFEMYTIKKYMKKIMCFVGTINWSLVKVVTLSL
jgi:hypothetical protein